MNKPVKLPFFRLSLLSLALAGGFAHAQPADSSVELPTVEVKGQATSATHRVTTKSMAETTATDLKDVLAAEPSISFGGGNGQSQWVAIRGMGQDQIDYKVDDTYTDSQIFHHNGRFMLDPALVKVVAVQKGTGSASAGIGATSGAIIAETVEAKDLLRDGQNAGFRVNAGASSNKGFSYGATAYGRAGGFDGLVSGNFIKDKEYRGGHNYRNLEGGDKVLNSALGGRGLLGKIGYSFNEDNRIELSHRQEKNYGMRALREEFDFSQILNDRGVPNTERNAPRYRTLTQDTTNLEFKGGNLGFAESMKANVYRLNIKRDESATDPAATSPSSTTQVTTLGANVGFDSRLFDRHNLKYGINWRTQEAKPSAVDDGFSREKKTDSGAYVEGIWDINPVTLTTGLRYDHWKMRTSSGTENSDGDINPSIGVIYDITPDFSVNASHNYATRSPRLYEAALSGGRRITSSPNLKAERSRNTEIGFNYYLNRDLSLSGSYFWQNIKDVQAVRRDGQDYVWYNGGRLKNTGYELNAAYRWKGLTARAGVAYSKPELDGETADIVTTAIPMGRTWTTGLSYQFDNPNLEIGWRGRYVQNAGYAPTSRGSGSDLPVVRAGYGVNDIFANWKPTGKDDLNVNFAVNNVFDKNYKPHSQRAGANALPEPGRDIRLGVNYRF
ncbi:TonB-dependent receptor plug domain-containing protein [Neisseria sp.]|uniref:TonB-dependent receptor plug domain-containing protein n=1 Tax=Neisseria sp. TaxID=192066 RepID=UPI00359FFDC1